MIYLCVSDTKGKAINRYFRVGMDLYVVDQNRGYASGQQLLMRDYYLFVVRD